MYLIFYSVDNTQCDDNWGERVQASGELSSVLEPTTNLQLTFSNHQVKKKTHKVEIFALYKLTFSVRVVELHSLHTFPLMTEVIGSSDVSQVPS